jgi:hypothetical protein
MLKLRVSTSPLTGNIYAGTLSKSGNVWRRKQDVTGDVCAAVAQHCLMKKVPVVVTENGKPKYEISVKLLE